jgi:hypothetical protein
MIRRSTVVYVVLLLVLVGGYIYLKNREKPANAEATATPSAQVSYLFTAEQGTPSDIRIESKAGKTVEIARGADKAWEVNQPIQAQANQGAAEAAASQVTTIRVLGSVPNVGPKVVGLDTPEYVLTIKFTSGEKTINVGAVTPTESGYYVRDPAGKIIIVSKDGIDALVSLLDNPPYQETLTPAPTTPVTGTPPSATATP